MWAILSLIFGVFGLIGMPVSVICGIVGLVLSGVTFGAGRHR